jgi:S1-C subfamily serine protease
MYIQQVNDGGPAARAGLQKGDVITAAAGRPVRYRDEYVRTYRERKPGDPLELTVLRPDGAGKRSATVTLGCLEIGWPQSP